MTEKVIKNPKKIRQLIHTLAPGSGFLTAFAIIFFTLFHIFERIIYDSISSLNCDFAIQIDFLIGTISSSVMNYGMQLFYSDVIKTMMGSETFSNTGRAYMTRDLNTPLSSTGFAEPVIIHDDCTEYVYSTDPSFPDQPIDIHKRSPIHQSLISRTNEDRPKPIYYHENGSGGKECYILMLHEVYPDGTPKSSTLIITIKSNWYKKPLLASNPSSDLTVINRHGDILVSASDSPPNKHTEYYPMITRKKNSGYLIDNREKEICMYYEFLTMGHIYMKISPLQKTLPRLLYSHRVVIRFMAVPTSIFGTTLAALLIFALVFILRLRDAIKTTDKLLKENGPDMPGPPDAPSLPLGERVNAVVSKSEYVSSEQVLYDMLAGKLSLSPSRLFKNQEGPFGLMLIHAQHRKDIYEPVGKQYPETVVVRSSHIYVCIGIWESEKDYKDLAALISQSLNCYPFKNFLFMDFEGLVSHLSNLNEPRKLGLVLNEEEFVICEEALAMKTPAGTITTRDFTGLTVRLKLGSLDLSRARWLEILGTIKNYRHDDF